MKMHKLLNRAVDKARSHYEGVRNDSSQQKPLANEDWQGKAWDAAPTMGQIYAYRMQRGVNLGSLFTLETWLVPSLFRGVEGAKSEHDLCTTLPAQEVRARLERHWANFIDEGDWRWMRDNGVNTVRLPICYYHYLAGHPSAEARSLLHETEYHALAHVYQGAYAHIVRIVETAAQFQIGVLLDLHGAPGAQNTEGHCGSSSGRCDFYSDKNRKKTIAILLEIANTFAGYDNVVGIELLNEPAQHSKLAGWYADAAQAISSRHGSRLPIYLGDCWQAEQFANLLKDNKHLGFLVLDHHLYRCFTPNDHSKTASLHASEIDPHENGPSYGMLKRASATLQGNMVIGEWSAALHHTSLKSCADEGQKKVATRAWAHAQLKAYEDTCAGFYFWTLKKEGPTDVGWCLYSAIEQGVLPSGLRSRQSKHSTTEEMLKTGEEICRSSFEGHVSYWNEHANGQTMHHERYRDGFQQIWKDCMAFYASGKNTIGFSGRWIEQRAKAHSTQYQPDRSWDMVDDADHEGWQSVRDGGVNEWEFVHGGECALKHFKEIFD
jgi:hypothetical protein